MKKDIWYLILVMSAVAMIFLCWLGGYDFNNPSVPIAILLITGIAMFSVALDKQ